MPVTRLAVLGDTIGTRQHPHRWYGASELGSDTISHPDVAVQTVKEKVQLPMDIHGLPIQSLWTAVRWLPGFMLKQIFPQHRLAELQFVDLQPRGEAAAINLGEVTSYSLWLNIINLSPFEVELDRAEFDFWFAGTSMRTHVLNTLRISPGQIATLQLSGTIPGGHADAIARTLRMNSSYAEGALTGWIGFNCKLHRFKKQIGGLQNIRPSVINAQYRSAA